MTLIVEFVCALLDLVKAELEQSKTSLTRLVTGLLVISWAVFFVVVAFGLFLTAIFLALLTVLNVPLSAMITGFVALFVGVSFLCLGSYSARH